MKALNLYGVGDLRYEDVPDPTPKAGEVLVQIRACGICGSDIPRIFTKGTYHFPTIPGHEFSGQVVALGEGVDESYLGKRAAIFPMLPCGECESCQVGEYATCKNYNYFGSRCDGGFAEYIAVPVWNLVLLPESLSYCEAAMAEPASVAAHALRRGGIVIGDTVAIFGAGPIGLMLAQWAKAWGAFKVILVDIDPTKLDFARKQGFEYVINSAECDPVAAIQEITGGRGADLCVEGAGVSQTLEQCLKSVRSFGRIVAMGNPAGDMHLSQKGYWELLRKQATVTGTWNSSYVSLPKNDWHLSIEAMDRGLLNIKPFITHKVRMEDHEAVFDLIRNKKEFYNKIMFVMGEEK